jgi:hypothetical protein
MQSTKYDQVIIFFFKKIFRDRVSLCRQAGLELLIPLLQSSKCWDYKYALPCLTR